MLSRMAFQSSAQECSLRLGGCSCTCRLWQAVKRTCSQLGLGSAPVGRKAAVSPVSGAWRGHLGPIPEHPQSSNSPLRLGFPFSKAVTAPAPVSRAPVKQWPSMQWCSASSDCGGCDRPGHGGTVPCSRPALPHSHARHPAWAGISSAAHQLLAWGPHAASCAHVHTGTGLWVMAGPTPPAAASSLAGDGSRVGLWDPQGHSPPWH